jgi:hypothetical protein
MQDSINWPGDIDIIAHIMFDEFELLMTHEMGDIVHIACDQIVHADHIMSFADEAISQVGAQESRCPCNQYAHILPTI